MATAAGRYRHRIAIQQAVEKRGEGGSVEVVWVTIPGNESVPARIVYSTAREFIAAQQMQSEIVGKISIRHTRQRDSFTGKVRIVHNGKIFNTKGFLPDNNSGTSELTAFVTQGLNEG